MTSMQIQSLNSPLPQDSGKPVAKRLPLSNGTVQGTESFAGPNTSRLLLQLAGMDGVRPDLVQRVRDDIRDGIFPGDERTRLAAERLSALL